MNELLIPNIKQISKKAILDHYKKMTQKELLAYRNLNFSSTKIKYLKAMKN